MLTRREWGLSTAAALTAACAATPEAEPEPEAPAGPLYFDLHIDTPGRMVAEGLDLAETYWWTSVDIRR